MRYRKGRVGRVGVVRLEDGEDCLSALAELAKAEEIHSAVFYILGGIKRGSLVLGPGHEGPPPEPIWHEVAESSEVLGIGTIFWDEEAPRVHLHTAVGRADKVHVGCLRQEGETFLVLEAVVMEIEGVEARRLKDPATGLSLLEL